MEQLTQNQWHFDWGTQQVGGLTQHEETGWILCGRSNSTPAMGWLVAHDIFHHAPNDTGTYIEEIATFGAQTLFEMHSVSTETFKNTLATSWFSVMALVLENGTRGAEGLIIDKLPDQYEEHALSGLWRQAYREALSELKDVFQEWAEEDVWVNLSSSNTENSAVAWVAYGFEQSQQRWPNIEKAREEFRKIESLAREIKPGSRLSITQNEDGSVNALHYSLSTAKTMRMR